MNSKIWKKLGGSLLKDKSVGIVGLGEVGMRVARLVRAFGASVVYTDIKDKPDAAHIPARRTDLQTLLELSDVVTLHASLTDQTRGMIGTREFARMKNTAILINSG